MKSKMVVWGQKADQKVLVALSLRAKDNKIDVYTFPEELATEELYKSLTQDWRQGIEVEFPEGYTTDEIELMASGSILPEGVTVDNADLINRTQTEWHFAVLSSKLSANYASELEIIKDKIDQITSFSQPLWNDLKAFWEKVQVQIRDKNIFVEHINDLKKSTNEAFDALKEKRKEMDKTFNESSSKVKEDFMNILNEIDEKVLKGLSLQPLFEELKKLQSTFRTAMMNNHDKKNVWDRLDGAFKAIKEKRFGSQGDNTNPNSAKERLDNRFNGLISAIGKMEKSIQFDKNDLEYQNKKIDGPGGQLEVQIRQAKVKMLEDRIDSKQLKLNDMLKTKEELEQRRTRMEKNEAFREEKEEAKKAVQDKIAASIKAAAESRSENAEDLEKAAQMIAESKKSQKTPEKESLLGAIGTILGESLEDTVDSIKAVASVVGDKLGDAMDDMKEYASNTYNDLTKKSEAEAANESNEEVEKDSSSDEIVKSDSNDIQEDQYTDVVAQKEAENNSTYIDNDRTENEEEDSSSVEVEDEHEANGDPKREADKEAAEIIKENEKEAAIEEVKLSLGTTAQEEIETPQEVTYEESEIEKTASEEDKNEEIAGDSIALTNAPKDASDYKEEDEEEKV